MRHSSYDCNQGCPVEATLEVIGGKWKGVILYHLLERPYRFGEPKRTMQTATRHMLKKQVRGPEGDGLIPWRGFSGSAARKGMPGEGMPVI